jgi:hypothetical protein
MRHFVVGTLMFGFGVAFTSFAANALQLWAIAKHVPYDNLDPVPEMAEFLLPAPGLKRGADCAPARPAPSAGLKFNMMSPKK